MKSGNTFEELEALEENWNGDGAPIVDRQSIAKAKELMGILDTPLSIFTTNDGIVQLDGSIGTVPLELEIEVYPEVYSVLLWEGDEIFDSQLFFTPEDVKKYLEGEAPAKKKYYPKSLLVNSDLKMEWPISQPEVNLLHLLAEE